MREERPDPATPAAAAPAAPAVPPEEERSIFPVQVALVRRNMQLAVPALIVNALAFAFVLWPVQPRRPLLIWLAAIGALAALRWLHHVRSARSIGTPAGRRRWRQSFTASVVLSGLIWGSAALVTPMNDLTHLVFMAFLTAGLAAGSMVAYAALDWLPEAFLYPSAGCVALALALRGDEMSWVMAAMIVLFAAMLTVMARAMHHTLVTSLRLREENRGLVTYLTDAKAGAERLNTDLTQRIVERERAERALRESEERFRSLVESATDGIGFTFEGRIYYANQAALDLIGYPAEEVLGQPVEEFLAATTLSKDEIYQRYVDRIAGKPVPQHYETQMVRKDGTLIDVMFSNSLVSLDGRQGVMSLVKDITERKKAEHELRVAKDTAEEATRLKDQFVSLLAHDLRAPLNSIVSILTLLGGEHERPLPAEQRHMVRLAAEQGDATLRMIEDLLSVSRLHTGKLKPDWRFVDATSIAATAASLLKPLAAEKQVALLDEVPHHTRLYTDAEMFCKVIYNLLSNALKFCPRGGRVRVFVPPGRPTTVAVQDDGAGVRPDLVADLFRHEVKTSTSGTAGERGTGLGLPLSQDLMRALGGEITLESTGAQGSVFYATLPVVRPKVLVVGRDESLALFARPHLESIDAEFVAAADGDEALRALEQDGAHLVIVEADLRGNGGLLLQRIRETRAGRSVPLLVIADKSEAGLLEEGFRLGADEIVVKPLVPDDFLVRLRRFIG